MKRGFTLVEVCVALLVFAFTSAALLRWVDGFTAVSNRERDFVQSFVAGASKMERFVEFPPPCADTLIRDSANILSFMKRSGREGLLLISVKSGGVELKRMVKCHE